VSNTSHCVSGLKPTEIIYPFYPSLKAGVEEQLSDFTTVLSVWLKPVHTVSTTSHFVSGLKPIEFIYPFYPSLKAGVRRTVK